MTMTMTMTMTIVKPLMLMILVGATAISFAEDAAKESSKGEKAPDEVKVTVMAEDYEYNIIVKSDGTHDEYFTGTKKVPAGKLSEAQTKKIFEMVDAIIAGKPEDIHYSIKEGKENYLLQIKRSGLEQTFLVSSLPSKKKVPEEMRAVITTLSNLTKW
jgi:hypothetical protein